MGIRRMMMGTESGRKPVYTTHSRSGANSNIHFGIYATIDDLPIFAYGSSPRHITRDIYLT